MNANEKQWIKNFKDGIEASIKGAKIAMDDESASDSKASWHDSKYWALSKVKEDLEYFINEVAE